VKVQSLLRVESTGGVSALLGNGGTPLGVTFESVQPDWLGPDISFAGARADQRFGFYVPTRGVVFAAEDSTVQIDGGEVALKRDGFIILLPGVHTIQGREPLIVEVFGRGREGSPQTYGSYLVYPQDLEKTHPSPNPLGGFGELALLISLSALLPIAIVSATLLRRRLSSLRSQLVRVGQRASSSSPRARKWL